LEATRTKNAHHGSVVHRLRSKTTAITYRNFEISVDLNLDGKKAAINIRGPRNAVTIKDEKLYQNALALVEELIDL
jgi:hypothetical protein